MAGGSIFKAFLIPAVIALIAYAALSYLILPFVRRHRQRYNQYLPVNPGLSSISESAASLHHRLGDALMSFFFPSPGSWRHRGGMNRSAEVRGSEDIMFDDDEGEDMVGFEIDDRRREALERRRSGGGDEYTRLSRDLEEGFKDDSDDEVEGTVQR